jgi:hypothetical protein
MRDPRLPERCAMRRLSLAALLAASLFAPTASASWHVGAAAVDEIDGEETVMASVAYLTEAEHPWEFIVGYIDGRDSTVITTPGTAWISASKRFTWNRWFVQSGIAYADADNEVLSKHFQFQTGAGYDFGRLSLSLRHLSNANTGGRNRGETFLLVDYAL